jgi:tetratricopeptide (TPR) repeat protein
MTKNDKTEDWMAHFLEQQPQEQQKLLDDALQSADEAKELASLIRQIETVTANQHLLQQLKTIQQISDQTESLAATPAQIKSFERVMNPTFSFWKIALLLCIASLIPSLWYLVARNNKHSVQQAENCRQIALPYLQPFEITLHLPDNPANTLQKGIQAYQNRNFPAAASLLLKAAQTQPDAPLLFYLGTAQLLAGKPDDAVKTLNQATLIQDEALGEDARWYLALAYLRLGQIQKARELLAILSREGYHQEPASLIMKQLDQLN